jgi:hypothetical protein
LWKVERERKMKKMHFENVKIFSEEKDEKVVIDDLLSKCRE